MRKFVCSTILVFAVALICAACGTADKKEKSDAVSKSEEAKTETAESEAQGVNTEKSEAADAEKGNNESDWITEWIKSESSDDEICAVGSVETTERFMGEAMQMAVMNAQGQLCQMIAIGKICKLPPSKQKGWRQDEYTDENGRFSIYGLICIDRKDLEENKKEESEEKEEDKVVQ